jgi:hypothetical protein
MVLTPEQAEERFAKKNAAKLKGLEEKIDDALETSIDQRFAGIYLDAKEFCGNGAIFARLKQLYENAGWRVNYQCDQRDGDYLVFTKKGGTQYD